MDLARIERATSTFAESRSDSAELQVRTDCEIRTSQFEVPVGGDRTNSEIRTAKFAIPMAEMERFERSQDFSRHLSRVLPYQLGNISRLAEG